jgi:hypothetical protein
MSRLAKFGRFWWEFIVGEDWRASAQIGLAIAATAAIAASGISAWWVLPPAVILVLYASLRRAIRD